MDIGQCSWWKSGWTKGKKVGMNIVIECAIEVTSDIQQGWFCQILILFVQHDIQKPLIVLYQDIRIESNDPLVGRKVSVCFGFGQGQDCPRVFAIVSHARGCRTFVIVNGQIGRFENGCQRGQLLFQILGAQFVVGCSKNGDIGMLQEP